MNLKNLISGTERLVPATPLTKSDKKITTRDIYHSRFNHGPNIGSMFVLEKWIFDEMFTDCQSSGGSELDAIAHNVARYGVDKTQKKLESHWKSFLSDDDWDWLRSKGVTGIRAPVGFWDVNNGSFTSGTPFESYAQIYSHAWDMYKSLVIDRANQYGIAVLVDLHGLPGGANDQEHSGTSSHKAELWSVSKYRSIALDVLEFIAMDLKSKDNVCGIQILNEAPYISSPKDQEKFYSKAIKRIRLHNSDVPVIISDGWNLDTFIHWVREQDSKVGNYSSCGIIIDTHIYKCFSVEDKRKPPSQLINDVDNAFPDNTGVDLIVGEYSCVLDGASYSRENCNRNDVVTHYGRKQNDVFYKKARAGIYFWTYRFQHGTGGEWGFREMTDRHCIPVYSTSPIKSIDQSNEAYKNMSAQATSQHREYWVNQDSNRDWQIWRFEEGFKTGWNDARAFDEFNRSQIGRLQAWSKSRLGEHIKERGYSDLVWSWTHGFMQGVDNYVHFSNES